MHEYERQWSRAAGHGVRHPLRLKMDSLAVLCTETSSAADFDARLRQLQDSSAVGDELLADELLPWWQVVCAGGRLPFDEA